MKKIISILLTIITLSAILSTCLTLTSCSSEEIEGTGITSAKIEDDKQKIVVKASLDKAYTDSHKGSTVYLLALPTVTSELSLAGAEIVSKGSIGNNMTFTFSLYGTDTSTRLACAFVLAEKSGESYVAISAPYYVTNPEKVASISRAPKNTSGIKGFATSDVSGAGLLGASHILLDARMDKLILADYTEDAIKFNYDGVSYFYDAEEVAILDAKVSEADATDMRVYFKTFLGYPDSYGDLENKEFLYLSARSGKAGYLPNMSDSRARRYVGAFYAFLASRYPVADFMIGDSVNAYATNCYAGAYVDDDELIDAYSFWARTAHLVLRSTNSQARIYISTASSGEIKPLTFLSKFALSAKAGGDFDYSVAIDLCNGDDLSALLNGAGQDVSVIGASNLSDLTAHLDKPELRYKGERRSVIISGLTLSPEVNETNRAMYYAFTYYSAAENGFSAFFCDNTPKSPIGTRSKLHYAILVCGTDKTADIKEYLKAVKGAEIPKLDDHVSNKIEYVQKPKTELPSEVTKIKNHLSLTFDDFESMGAIKNSQGLYNEDAQGKVSRSWLVESDPTAGVGVLTAKLPAKELISSAYFAIKVTKSTSPRIALVINTTKDEGTSSLYVAEAKLANGSATYYFDLSEFAKDVDSSDTLAIALYIMPDEETDEMQSIEIEEMALYGNSGAGIESIIIIIVVIVAVLLIGGLVAFLVIRRTMKKKRTAGGNSDE